MTSELSLLLTYDLSISKRNIRRGNDLLSIVSFVLRKGSIDQDSTESVLMLLELVVESLVRT